MARSGTELLGKLGADAQPWLLESPPGATSEDIFYCFRLILGRLPNREEWPGHSLRAGESLENVVASYLQSLEFAQRRLLDPGGLGDVALAELPGFRIFTAAGDAAVGQHVRQDNYELDVTSVFRQILRPGMGVVDIGANIGYFSMLSASIVGDTGYVLAIEPNPRNARLLEASRRANNFQHVTLAQVAAGEATGILVLHTSHSNGTTSEPPTDLSSLLASESVACVRADALVKQGRRIDLVKVDVEGAEYLALRGCQELIKAWHPVIISEFSPGMMEGISRVKGEEYLRWLIGLNYNLSIINSDGGLESCGDDWPRIMRRHSERGSDHLDIVANPATTTAACC